jgi:hypothetical protein
MRRRSRRKKNLVIAVAGIKTCAYTLTGIDQMQQTSGRI